MDIHVFVYNYVHIHTHLTSQVSGQACVSDYTQFFIADIIHIKKHFTLICPSIHILFHT